MRLISTFFVAAAAAATSVFAQDPEATTLRPSCWGYNEYYAGSPAPSITAVFQNGTSWRKLSTSTRQPNGAIATTTAILTPYGMNIAMPFEAGATTTGNFDYFGTWQTCTLYYLKVVPPTGSESYRALEWDMDPNTVSRNWSVVNGGSLTTNYPGFTSFMACTISNQGAWFLYIQTGADIPNQMNCVPLGSLHVDFGNLGNPIPN